MKNHEEAIERVLAGLRDVEAPDGMERRILDGLEGRAVARPGWRFVPMWLVPQGRFAARGLGWGLLSGAALAGVVLALAIPAVRRAGRTPDHSKIAAGPVEAAPMAHSVIAARDEGPSSPGRGAHSSGTEGMKNASVTGSVREADFAHPDDSVALSETQAASFPAPPVPLTGQERLLLRLVHKVDPVEIAMLDPKVQAIEDAKERAEFQRFFGQTTEQALPGQLPPGQSATEQTSPQQSTTELTAPEQPAAEQAMPVQSSPGQVVPAQPAVDQSTPDQPAPEQPAPQQSRPQNIAPDQSTITQQLTPRPTRTGENE